jgi:5-methylcytosine-specific restriction endonuclease McrBC GTP-binding regulatory subunit McrB
MPENIKPIQKILFGSPGTGKSYQIQKIAIDQLKIPFDEATKMLSNTVKTVFHPEYTYADFMGKLLPLTQGNSIIYKFYPGHFIRILGMAYKGLIEGKKDHYLLVIDELNRGNAAAIFGTVFQLLDRESDGWSSYEVDISDMELVGLLEAMRLKPIIQDGTIEIKEGKTKIPCEDFCQRRKEDLAPENPDGSRVFSLLQQRRIKMPHNLSILATINTSDESIYYLDSAFKRRWDWEYVKAPHGSDINIPEKFLDVKLIINGDEQETWLYYIVGINELIKSNYQVIRRIEDKQIGWWFIKPENGKVDLDQVKDKLMFYLWDSVFSRDKRPLEQFLSTPNQPSVKLTGYSDFIELTEEFMMEVYNIGKENVRSIRSKNFENDEDFWPE